MNYKLIYVVFDKEAGKIYSRSVTISETALDYYTMEEIAKIIGGGNSVMSFPPDQYDGPIDEHITFSVKVIGDYAATMITKEDNNND